MPYVIDTGSGAATPVFADLPFTTSKRKVAADEVDYYRGLAESSEAAAAIVAGATIDQETFHPAGAIDLYDADDRDRFFIVEVPLSLPEAQAQQLAAAEAQYETRRQSAMAWDFAAVTAKDDTGADLGASGAQTLQMRDTPDNPDQKNWLAAAQSASVAVMGGSSDTVLPLKTTANVWVQTTAAQVLQVLVTGDGTQVSAVARGQAMLAHYGAVKAQINAAADAAAALAIDVTAGWPA